MDGSAFRGLSEAIAFGFILLIVSVPLALWKLVDIVIWIYNNVSIVIK